MAKVDIVETTLQDGTTGQCAYIDGATFTDFKMTIQKHLIEGNRYTISFLYKTNVQEVNHIELLSGGYDVVQLRRIGTTRIGVWEKCQITFTSDGNYPVLYFPNYEYWMYALMVEEGTVASTWSASVNDTRVDTESIIDQKSDSITIKVEGAVLEKVGEDFVQKNNVIAEINAQVDPEKGTSEVQINAGAINLNGYATINDNFHVDTDGKMHCKDAEIVGGTFNVETDDTSKNVVSISGYDEIDRKTTNVTISGSSIGIEAAYSTGQKTTTLISDYQSNFHGLLSADTIITTGGANLDGNVKSHTEVSAKGTSSAFPVANIASIPDGSDIRIEVGVPLDNASTPTVAWFSFKTKKPSGTADYLFNAGGYYYSNNYYGSVFVKVSASRVTIDGSWSRAYYNGTTLNFKSSSSQIYVYTEHL